MKYAIQGYEDVAAEHLLGIFGNPIKHTLSPVIHDTLSDALGLSERYVPFCVEDEDLSRCVKLAYDEGVLGLNITVPHKQHVMESLVDVARLIHLSVWRAAIRVTTRICRDWRKR